MMAAVRAVVAAVEAVATCDAMMRLSITRFPFFMISFYSFFGRIKLGDTNKDKKKRTVLSFDITAT